MPTSETITVFQKIAVVTGLSPWTVEIGSVVLFTLIIVVIIYVVLTISRIRKEIINLNLAVRYLVRLLKQEIEGGADAKQLQNLKERLKKVSEKVEEKAPVEETKKEVDSDTDWKL
jgi:Sec-independent protein translocase protein TatA